MCIIRIYTERTIATRETFIKSICLLDMAFGKKKGKKKLFTRDKKGYKKFADSGKSVHRHVAERKIGRKLRKGEVVHHKNRDKSDNRRSNLEVFKSQKTHHASHKKSKKKTGKW